VTGDAAKRTQVFLVQRAARPARRGATFGIDMILPTLSATGSALGVPASDIGIDMSVYLLSLGATLLVYGPLSDRIGRKPIVGVRLR
jgi:MFS family permease